MLRANVWKQRWAATSVALLAGIALAACGPPAPAANVTAVTLGNTGAFGNGTSNTVMASQDGNLVAFLSGSSDLVAGDTNGVEDVFLRNVSAGTTVRIATSTPLALMRLHRISANGRYVSILRMTPSTYDWFVYDTTTGVTTPMPSSIPNQPFEAITDSGLTAVLGTNGNGVTGGGCALADLATQTGRPCDTTGTNNVLVAVSANGEYMLVRSVAAGNIQEAVIEVATGNRVAVNLALSGGLANTAYRKLSNDGTKILIGHPQVPAGVYDVASATFAPLPGSTPNGLTWILDISSDGNLVAVVSKATNLGPLDTNVEFDTYIWNRSAGTISRITPDIVSNLTPGQGRNIDVRASLILANATRLLDVTIHPYLAADTTPSFDGYLLPI